MPSVNLADHLEGLLSEGARDPLMAHFYLS